MFWYLETIKIKVPLLWLGPRPKRPHRKHNILMAQSRIGNASKWASTSSNFLSPVSHPTLFPCSFSPLPFVFPFPLSVCLHLFLLLLLLCFSVFYIPSPSCPPLPSFPNPPLNPWVSTRQRVIHLHWGDICAVLTASALMEQEEGKQQPHDSKDTLSVGKHIRPSITKTHPILPTLWVLGVATGVWFNNPQWLQRCSISLLC